MPFTEFVYFWLAVCLLFLSLFTFGQLFVYLTEFVYFWSTFCLLFTEFVYISDVCLPDPQRSTRAKSLPVPKGTMAQGGFEQRESCPTLSKH